jgi:phenylacetate-CoA ligase
MGVRPRDWALEVGHFGGEPWTEDMRRRIEADLSIKAFNNYGLSEVMGPGVAGECVHQTGMHVHEDHFLMECVDPETLEPVPAGQTGELIFTTLTKRAMPMLRYRTRDLAAVYDDPCPCGRTHRRIGRIVGRSDDMLIIRGVNVYPSQVEAVLVGLPGLAPHYQLVVERKGNLDELTIEVEAASASFTAEQIEGEVRHHVKSMIGVSAGVVVKKPGEIPRSQGKAVRVRDLRPKP